LDEAADGVVGKCSRDGGAHAKATSKATGDVVLAAAFPNGELPRGVNAAFAGVETKHDFAEAEAIPATIRIRKQNGFHIRSNETVTHRGRKGDVLYRWRRRGLAMTRMATEVA